MDSKFEERRNNERKPLILDAKYEFNKTMCSCQIIDITSQGMTIRVKGFLMAGDKINITLDKNNFAATVDRVDGNIIGVKFEQLSDEQLDYIMNSKNF